jgi:hypothetical protein
MDDNVILHVGDMRFLLGVEEALGICNTLNSANSIEKAWFNGTPSDRSHVIKPPAHKAMVSPMTTIFQMELEQNTKALEEKNK